MSPRPETRSMASQGISLGAHEISRIDLRPDRPPHGAETSFWWGGVCLERCRVQRAFQTAKELAMAISFFAFKTGNAFKTTGEVSDIDDFNVMVMCWLSLGFFRWQCDHHGWANFVTSLGLKKAVWCSVSRCLPLPLWFGLCSVTLKEEIEIDGRLESHLFGMNVTWSPTARDIKYLWSFSFAQETTVWVFRSQQEDPHQIAGIIDWTFRATSSKKGVHHLVVDLVLKSAQRYL